ncbi:hypothetical protein [Planctomycetes bacterium TBK1r]|uniref:hypothetical protein n=1 Tax=Stieleria magnilauensis TaxID=2527963 RepID=UPI0011A2DE3B
MILSAAGHWVYVALRTVDRNVSSAIYRGSGHDIAWIGHGSLKESVDRVRSNATGSLSTDQPTVLPFSPFWFGVGIGFTLLAAISVWSCRWVSDTGIQSLVGLLAGHALWIGNVEIGLDLASRRLGLAAAIDVVSGRTAGVHGSGALIQLSCIFLLPILIGLTFHDSNRCVVFQWFRRRLPISNSASPSGRIDNYAPRTMIQFFMTVWVCYVAVLWMADPSLGFLSHVALLMTLVAIAIATPYMIWKSVSQTTPARMLRYSVSGAVVTWTGIEIASATGMMSEPWLRESATSGVIFVGGSVLLTAMSAAALAQRRKNITITVQ